MGLQPRGPLNKGPSEWFMGDVSLEFLLEKGDQSPVNIAAVHFGPCGRTAWHSHEGGQILYVTEGEGLVQARGEEVVALHAGDVHVTADGTQHWHGATAEHAMVHLSITQGLATWGEHVTDVEYGR